MEDMTILYQGLSTLDTIHNFFNLLIASFKKLMGRRALAASNGSNSGRWLQLLG